ncbi:MAG: CAP domain-containing protein [Planctomycetota bacterium]|nr:CAP domain-containing protein [Planctomycetota bacterium]
MRILALILLLTLVGFQEPSPRPSLSQRQGAAMRVLRDRRTTPEQVEAAVEELLGLSAEACGLLGRHLERVLKKERKENSRGRDALVKAYVASAQKLMGERLAGEGQEKVDRARVAILKTARGKELPKEAIKKISQPAREELEETLIVLAGQIWLGDEELFEQWVEHLDALTLETLHYSWLERAREELLRLGQKRTAKKFKDQGDPTPLEAELLRDLDWLAVLATPMTAQDRKVLEANRALGMQGELDAEEENSAGSDSDQKDSDEAPGALPGLGPEEVRGIFALNRLRVLIGLNALQADLALCAAARDHSRDMVELGFFAHASPVPGRETPWKRAAARGTSAGAENIAAGQRTGEAATDAWWFSPGHHKNMLGGAKRCGLGHVQAHWTQLLGG